MTEQDLVRAVLLQDASRVLVQILDDFSHIVGAGVYERDGRLVKLCSASVVHPLYEEGVVLGQPHLSDHRTYIHRQPIYEAT